MNENVRVLHTHRILQLHVATTIYEDKHTIVIVMGIYRYMCTLSGSSIKRDKCTYFTHLVTTVSIKWTHVDQNSMDNISFKYNLK